MMIDEEVISEAERTVKKGLMTLILSACLLFGAYQFLHTNDPNKFLVLTTFLLGVGAFGGFTINAITDDDYKVVREHGMNPGIRLFAIFSSLIAGIYTFALVIVGLLIIGA